MEKITGASKKGFALLLTMSILMVLSIALIKIFEDRSLEVAHLENSTQQFKAESVARSVFRVLLTAIKEKGLYPVFRASKSIPAGIPINVIDQGSFSELSIQPIDHRFHLNDLFQAKDPDRATIFKNVLIQCQQENNIEEDETYFELNEQDVFGIISAINDWRDEDSEPDEEYMDGIEYYGFEKHPFEIKNSSFDYISEIKLIPRIARLNISDFILKKYFRVSEDRNLEDFLDINLKSKEEIIQFLKRYDDVLDFETVVANAEVIADIITQNTDSPTDPKYSISEDISSATGQFRTEMEQEGFWPGFTDKEVALFKVQTNYIELRYKISVDRYQLSVYALLKINYSNQKGDIANFDIYTFSMN